MLRISRLTDYATVILAALARSPPVALSRQPAPALTPVYLFTGKSASTPALIGRAEQTLGPAGRAAFVERSDALSLGLQEALERGDLPAAREACLALQALRLQLPTKRS